MLDSQNISFVENNKRTNTKVLTTIVRELENCSHFDIAVAFITDSGVACIWDSLLLLDKKEIKGRILTSGYLNFTQPEALEKLKRFKHIQLRFLPDELSFHAKGYFFFQEEKNFKLLIGSSNLTDSALSTNGEWNIHININEDNELNKRSRDAFEQNWNKAEPITENWLQIYREHYYQYRKKWDEIFPRLPGSNLIQPNAMQKEALQSLKQLREKNKNRALLISATGTGKTFLSAFDVKAFNPNRFLFIVHRELIAEKAKQSYQLIFNNDKQMGLFIGNQKDKNKDKPYLFATIQSLVAQDAYQQFKPDYFDYIVIDETHHLGGKTYQTLFNYFKPKFFLGMTATPERTDGYDIFSDFDHQIAYEIRLHQALEEKLLVPFHYHGISDFMVDGKVIDDTSQFNDLVLKDRIQHIVQNIKRYPPCGNTRVKGIMFCRSVKETEEISKILNNHYNLRTLSLSGKSTFEQREKAIHALESDDVPPNEQLDYILTCDLFNEGVDIPAINQIVMLRPTESAIIFIQQLGRGLRHDRNKEYLQVIDFIGNYQNNFMLPIALYGDPSYRKDNVKRLVFENPCLPGASTIYIEDIAKERIYNAINRGNMLHFNKLKEYYFYIKAKLGRVPYMMDFVKQNDKDPYIFVNNRGSYYDFVSRVEQEAHYSLSEQAQLILKFISQEIANGKRLEDIVLLKEICTKDSCQLASLIENVSNLYPKLTHIQENFLHAITVINGDFLVAAQQKKFGLDKNTLIEFNKETLVLTASPFLKQLLKNETFKTFCHDVLDYALYRYEKDFDEKNYQNGFIVNQTYTRKDVARILRWKQNFESTMYGYMIRKDNEPIELLPVWACPMFVTYQKSKDISLSTNYHDRFKDHNTFIWLTRSRVHLQHNDVKNIQNTKISKLLFIQKKGGDSFYFIGYVTPIHYVETKQKNDKGELLPIVEFTYQLQTPLEDSLYQYFEKGPDVN